MSKAGGAWGGGGGGGGGAKWPNFTDIEKQAYLCIDLDHSIIEKNV